MTALLILCLVAGALTLASAWADSKPAVDDDDFTQPTHCRVVKGGEL